MTQRPEQSQLDLIAAYLDGSLDEAQRRGLEASIAADPLLQAEVDFQKKLDDSLARLFDHDIVGSVGSALPRAGAPAAAPSALRPSRWRLAAWLAVAASVLLALGVVLYLSRPVEPELLGPAQVYAKMQERNFAPAWTCKDDQEFICTVQKRLGEGLLVPSDTPGLRVVGWVYAGSYFGDILSADSMVLITKIGDDNVLLVVDRASADRVFKFAKRSDLNLFRDTAGGLVLYEVTPRAQPAVIPVAKANKDKANCKPGTP
jgi:anti-sigma factor RsiW